MRVCLPVRVDIHIYTYTHVGAHGNISTLTCKGACGLVTCVCTCVRPRHCTDLGVSDLAADPGDPNMVKNARRFIEGRIQGSLCCVGQGSHFICIIQATHVHAQTTKNPFAHLCVQADWASRILKTACIGPGCCGKRPRFFCNTHTNVALAVQRALAMCSATNKSRKAESPQMRGC